MKNLEVHNMKLNLIHCGKMVCLLHPQPVSLLVNVMSNSFEVGKKQPNLKQQFADKGKGYSKSKAA